MSLGPSARVQLQVVVLEREGRPGNVNSANVDLRATIPSLQIVSISPLTLTNLVRHVIRSKRS